MTDKYPDQVRWFSPTGTCAGCGKPATGKLMGPRNDSYGAYCEPCANKRLRTAERERAKYEKAKGTPFVESVAGVC